MHVDPIHRMSHVNIFGKVSNCHVFLSCGGCSAPFHATCLQKILWIFPQHTVANEGLFVGIPQLIQQIVCCSLYYQHQLQPCTGRSVDHWVFSPYEKVLVTANKWLECNRWWFHIFFSCLPPQKGGSDPISLGHFQVGGLITTWTTLEDFISWEVNASFIRYLHGFSAQNVWITRTDKVLP